MERTTTEERTFVGINSGDIYTIRQAAAGNWCLDVEHYTGGVDTTCHKTADEAYNYACEVVEGGQLVEAEYPEEY